MAGVEILLWLEFVLKSLDKLNFPVMSRAVFLAIGWETVVGECDDGLEREQ